jgi:hypothetical protein
MKMTSSENTGANTASILAKLKHETLLAKDLKFPPLVPKMRGDKAV